MMSERLFVFRKTIICFLIAASYRFKLSPRDFALAMGREDSTTDIQSVKGLIGRINKRLEDSQIPGKISLVEGKGADAKYIWKGPEEPQNQQVKAETKVGEKKIDN